MNIALARLGLVFLAATLASFAPAPAKDPVKVFLLVGQSNMEGKGAIRHLDDLIADPQTTKEFAHLKRKGEWVERKDVWISYRRNADSHTTSGLTVGYGSKTDQIGPELGFGTIVGNELDCQVLVIKLAWGGANIREDFLPPGAGGPGGHYTRMLTETREVLDELKQHFKSYRGQGYEIAGLVWFQGWNDAVGKGNPEYAAQLSQFIRDVRTEFKAPALPVVIGELGQAGAETNNKGALAFRAQQKSVADDPEFTKTVSFVRTSVFIDPLLHEQFDVWSQCRGRASKATTDEEKEAAWADWKKIEPEYSKRTGDRPYHYFGSGEVFYRMGDAFGKAMVDLLAD
jgi:hypothetical protein